MANEELQQEIDRVWKTCSPVDEGMGVETANIHIEQFDAIARYFVRWQEERDKETIELAEDHAYFAGSTNEREKMLKDAIYGEISSVDVGDDSYVKKLNMPELQKAIRKFNVGDKVRVIIVKENEI
jgi:hypothetical protein